jgi:hypothetical protein
VPDEAVSYLKLMLQGIHRPALGEWVEMVADRQYDIQTEVWYLLIGHVLSPDTRRFFRIRILYMMNEAIRHIVYSIAQEQPNYADLLPVHPNAINAWRDLLKNAETQYQEFERSLRRNHQAAWHKLKVTPWMVWTDSLSRICFRTISRTCAGIAQRLFPAASPSKIAYCISPVITASEFSKIGDARVSDETRVTINNIPSYRQRFQTALQIMRFRQRMREAIEGADDP